ncbi:MAG: hypothetical protein LBJ73_01895 [Rickettsiales bacterium]|jgi:hypothetical protein|nr:hypothetical protein [Rickettsiales bacterium]
MSKAKKLMLGTLLVASLFGGKVVAQNRNSSQVQNKKERVVSVKKEFREPGILVARRGNTLISEINTDKFSPLVNAQRLEIESFVSSMSKELIPNMGADNPYNPNYFSEKSLKFVKKEVNKTKQAVMDRLLDLPLTQKKYEDIKIKLITLLLMTQSVDIMLAPSINNVNKNPQSTVRYYSFIRTALYIKMLNWMIEEDLKEMEFVKASEKSAKPVLQEKTR